MVINIAWAFKLTLHPPGCDNSAAIKQIQGGEELRVLSIDFAKLPFEGRFGFVIECPECLGYGSF